MDYINATTKTEQQMEALLKADDGGPVCMVNLLKFKEKAEYEDGRETDLSGIEAYQIYGAVTGSLIKKLGGDVVFTSVLNGMVVGEVEELWDVMAIAKYPTLQSFIDMVSSPEYLKVYHHRIAGLKGQLNIASTQVI
jgi:uncharacterized protein (DUF1330 family)|tara:strand:- start:7512 stop:7922 length:411 start_codon:yes stop_codon:yes gene_type:complete